MAAIATELAFEELTNISTKPLNALTASRYALATGHNSLTKNTLVIGSSVSGTVVRTREQTSYTSRYIEKSKLVHILYK